MRVARARGVVCRRRRRVVARGRRAPPTFETHFTHGFSTDDGPCARSPRATPIAIDVTTRLRGDARGDDDARARARDDGCDAKDALADASRDDARDDGKTTTTEKTTVGRRDLAAKTLAAMALTATPTIGAFAGPALALSGMNAVKDTREGYEFLYPVGWQEIQVDGQAAVYKDIIEPLESVALNVYPTQRESVRDIGTADEVAKTLVGKALTAPGAQAKVLATSERTDKDGHLYYQFEFVTKTQSYERHALTVVTVTQGKVLHAHHGLEREALEQDEGTPSRDGGLVQRLLLNA